MNPEQFAAELKAKGIILNKRQMEQFSIYFRTLVEWNEKMNLTAITEENDVYLKHFYDSISAAFFFDFSNGNIQVCDVGAGAGFPSIPLKICFPNLHVTIVDSLQKRIAFLNHLAMQLNLENVAFYHDRAETFGKKNDFRESYDVVMARAVARMSVLSELCLPLCKKNGVFIAMKGQKAIDEVNDANTAIRVLGGEIVDTKSFSLPTENSDRSIIIIEKERQTPKKYPRKPGMPNKEPIE